MELKMSEISELVFKRIDQPDASDSSVDIQSLNVLMALDGEKTISTIARETGYELASLQEKISLLLKMGMIEPIDGKGKILDAGFIEYLKGELSKAVGPIATILMEDVAADLGHEITYFPKSKAAQLISLLVAEIQREDQAVAFKKSMMEKMKP